MTAFVLPISVIMAPGFKNGRTFSRYMALYSTGVQRKMMSHAESVSSIPSRMISIVPSFFACSSFERVRMYAIMVISLFARRRPLAIEPPMRPRPIKPKVESDIL